VNRRRAGQITAALGALVAFAWAAWAARESAIPAVRVYDGFWMMLGAAITVLLVAPLVWRWPRQRSLVAIAIASVLGSFLPLVLSAIKLHMPVMARLRGAWILGGADAVGPALVIGFVCLWFAVRKHDTERRSERSE
jgi:hypothetical protein